MIDGNYVSVLIAAAGMSNRMGGNISKQFIQLGDRPVLAHTIQAFEESDIVDEIILILKEEDIEYCRQNIVKKYKFNKVTKLIRGGKERQDSVHNGIMALDPKSDIIISHDGARPFVTDKMIRDSVKKAITDGAAVVGVPVTDTIKMLRDGEGNQIDYTPKRSLLFAAQTPQTFKRDILVYAYEKAQEDDALGTDDSSLVERLGIKVAMVEGAYSNIKLTTPEDIRLAESLIKDGRVSSTIKIKLQSR